MATNKVKTFNKTVLELDLAGYSDIARRLEENLSAEVVMRFNDQIQEFVDVGLAAVALSRSKTVMATTGDGAILLFDNARDAHCFAQALHQAAPKYNAVKTVPSAKRWFRIGAATGEIAIKSDSKRQEMAGIAIANAVRLESKAGIGEILIDLATYNRLPEDLQHAYGNEEEVPGKRNEKFQARRCAMTPEPVWNADVPTIESILGLFDQLQPKDQLNRLMLLINMPIEHRPSDALTLF